MFGAGLAACWSGPSGSSGTAGSSSGAARSSSGAASTPGASSAKGTAQYVLDTESAALAAQARCYVYSRQNLAKSTFEDPAWRDALNAAFLHGGGGRRAGDKMPFLTIKGLRVWLAAEYEVSKMFAHFVAGMMHKYHEGNAFGPGPHD